MRLTFHNPFEQVFVADVSTHLSTYLLLTGVRVCVCVFILFRLQDVFDIFEMVRSTIFCCEYF